MDKKWSYSVQWTQPYNMSGNCFYNQNTVDEELLRLQIVDNIVESMSYYPEAQKIITKVQCDTRRRIGGIDT